MKPKIKLITRADDAGSCASANAAILRCVEAGTIKNVSFMACGPAIEEAAQLFRGRDDVALGLHVCLNAEWEKVKWGPVSHRASLFTDEKGIFFATPHETKIQFELALQKETLPHLTDSGIDLHDLWDFSEIHAQLNKLRDLGLPISYVDEHMGVSWIHPSLRREIVSLCREQGLFDAFSIPSLPNGATLDERFRAANLSRYVWINHPGLDEPDMQNFNLPGQPKGVVARERAAETAFLCGEEIREIFRKWRVETLRYDEI